MSTQPKISIVVPSFQQGAFIGETLDSILSQGYANLELIVIDGGSTDASVKEIEKRAEAIAYWVSEKDRGQSHAINKGMAKATGEICAWLNSDDLYLPDTFNGVFNAFATHPEAGVVHGTSEIFGEGMPSKIVGMRKGHALAQHIGGLPSPQPSCFFRRSIYERVGGIDERWHYGMDYDLLLRMALTTEIIYVEECWSRYRIHQDSKTFQSKRKFAEEWAAIYWRALKSRGDESLRREWQKLGLSSSDDIDALDLSGVSEEEFRHSFGFALHHQAVFYNQSGDVRKAVTLLKALQKLNKEVFDFLELGATLRKLQIKALLP